MFGQTSRVVGAITRADVIVGAVVAFLVVLGVVWGRSPRVKRAIEVSEELWMRFFLPFLLFWFALLPGWALYALASLTRYRSLWVQVPVFVLLAGVVGLLFWKLSTDERRRRLFDRIGKVTSGLAIPTVLAWTFLSAALGLFGSLTFALYDAGVVHLRIPGAAESAPGRVVDFYLWHFLEAIPILRVTETLRWDAPATYESPSVGWLLLTFKLFVIIPIIGIFRSYWQSRKAASDASSRQ